MTSHHVISKCTAPMTSWRDASCCVGSWAHGEVQLLHCTHLKLHRQQDAEQRHQEPGLPQLWGHQNSAATGMHITCLASVPAVHTHCQHPATQVAKLT